MRLVDADELTFDRLTDSICQGQAEDVVAEAPTIDAEPVVRCGECKYWTGYCTNKIWQSPTDDYLPQTYADDFCSYGERRAKC